MVIVLVLLWYAIDVVLLAFIGVLFAILLRAPADWLSERFGLPERWSLALVGRFSSRCWSPAAILFGRGIAAQALALVDRIPEIVASFKEQLAQQRARQPRASRWPNRAACSPAATARSSSGAAWA